MRHAIALNGSFFNTQRMVQEYVIEAYRECLLPYETRTPSPARPAAGPAGGGAAARDPGAATAEAAGAGSPLGSRGEG